MGSKKKRKNSSSDYGKLTKTSFCPLCGTSMRKVKTKTRQHAYDHASGMMLLEGGKPVYVSRVFYGCPKGDCNTVIWFDYREDGHRGDLSMELEFQKQTGVRPGGLSGSFKDIVD